MYVLLIKPILAWCLIYGTLSNSVDQDQMLQNVYIYIQGPKVISQS